MPGATVYECVVRQQQGDTVTEVARRGDLATPAMPLTGLRRAASFQWQARAGDGVTWSDWSPQLTFSVAALAPPVPAGPADKSVGVTLPTNLHWQATPGAMSYTVQVASDSAFTVSVLLHDVTDTAAPLEVLDAGATYCWRVRAGDGQTASDWSPTQTFTVAKAEGSICGMVSDAVTGRPLPGATVELREKAVDGKSVAMVTSTGDGYSFTAIPDGSYWLSAACAGYTGDGAAVTLAGGRLLTGVNRVLSPVLRAGGVRVVLTWGATPQDLDLHLFGPAAGGSAFEVNYLTPKPVGADASLDTDSTIGFGPETISISALHPGTYRVVVDNYSAETSLAASGARVQVYLSGAAAPQTFTVPATATGLDWTACTIDGATGAVRAGGAL